MKPETLRANAAALAEMSDPPSGIIDSLTEAAAEIERLEAGLAVEKEHHDYAVRELHKTEVQAATLREAVNGALAFAEEAEDVLAAACDYVDTEQEAVLGATNSGELARRLEATAAMTGKSRKLHETVCAYRAKGQADG